MNPLLPCNGHGQGSLWILLLMMKSIIRPAKMIQLENSNV